MATNEKLLIFDFDGVLLEDTGGLSHKIFAEQVPDLALDEYLSWFDGNVHATLEENRVRVDLQRFFADYARAIADIRVRPEMRAALGMLVGHNNAPCPDPGVRGGADFSARVPAPIQRESPRRLPPRLPAAPEGVPRRPHRPFQARERLVARPAPQKGHGLAPRPD